MSEPILLTRPKSKKAGSLTSSPTVSCGISHQNPSHDKLLTHDDAVEGTEAFRNRISEITSFRVYARVRPFIMEELADMEGQERRSVVEMTGTTSILLDPKENWTPKAQFEFDGSFWSIPPSHNIVHTFADTRRKDYSTQLDVYNSIAKDLVPHTFNGFNSCILTYGQTGSGKTYTMMGRYDPNASCGGAGEEGIIPRVSNDLFLILQERRDAEKNLKLHEQTKFRVEVSFVEIYMERVRDLLDPALRHTRGNEHLQDARIRQDPYSGPFVEGVTKYQVENWAQCCTLLERGSRHRTTCATAVHNQSSRSHAIFQLTLVQERVTPAKDRFSRPSVKTVAGRINLVDLAGSERGGFQDYVKESAAINSSLLALRRVIDNLTERQNILIEQAKAEVTGGFYQERPLPQVPFRDSVLTWLLSDSIGGNARTTMVATISPLVKNYGDTLATLQWSSKARNLVTLVKMNEQAVVRNGMSSHADHLGDTIQMQRSNLDDLRQTLRSKQMRAEALLKETRQLYKAVVKAKAQVTKVREDRAAIILQRSISRHHVAKKLENYKKHHAAMKERLANKSNDGNEEQLLQLRKDAERQEAAAKEGLTAAQRETDDMAAKVKNIAANRSDFDARRKEVTERYQVVRKQINADEIECRALAKVTEKLNEAKQSLAAEKNVYQNKESRLVEMRRTIAESKSQAWKDNVRAHQSELRALREKTVQLKARYEAAKMAREAVRARHNNTFQGG